MEKSVKENLKNSVVRSFNLDMVVKDLMDLIDENVLIKYIKSVIKDDELSLLELRTDIFKELNDEEFIACINTLGYNFKTIEEFNEMLDEEDEETDNRDLDEELSYYENMIYEYEVKGRESLNNYQFALKKVAEIKGLMAERRDI